MEHQEQYFVYSFVQTIGQTSFQCKDQNANRFCPMFFFKLKIVDWDVEVWKPAKTCEESYRTCEKNWYSSHFQKCLPSGFQWREHQIRFSVLNNHIFLKIVYWDLEGRYQADIHRSLIKTTSLRHNFFWKKIDPDVWGSEHNLQCLQEFFNNPVFNTHSYLYFEGRTFGRKKFNRGWKTSFHFLNVFMRCYNWTQKDIFPAKQQVFCRRTWKDSEKNKFLSKNVKEVLKLPEIP